MRTSPDRIGLPHLIAHFQRLAQVLKDESKSGVPLVMTGDINIDQCHDNDSLSGHDMKKLNKVLTDIKTYTGMAQLSFKPTRFDRAGHGKSLLNLLLSNAPENINNIETIHGHISDHMVVKLQCHCKELVTNRSCASETGS